MAINLTTRQLITGALGIINVTQQGEPPSADDIDLGLQTLDLILDEWATLSLAVYSYAPTPFNLVAGQQTYTLGPGGDFDIDRPQNIQQAYLNYNTGGDTVDLQITQVNDAEWAAIKVKNVSSAIPTVFYSSGEYPLTTLYFWPIPTVENQVTLWLWSPLTTYAALDDLIALPPGYSKALMYNLAVDLAPRFGKEIPPVVQAEATSSFARVRALNAVPQIMNCASGLTSVRKSTFNWRTGDTV